MVHFLLHGLSVHFSLDDNSKKIGCSASDKTSKKASVSYALAWLNSIRQDTMLEGKIISWPDVDYHTYYY